MFNKTVYTELDIEAYLDQNLVLKGFTRQQEKTLRDQIAGTIRTAPNIYQAIVMENPHDIVLGTKNEIRLLYGDGWKENIGGFYSRKNKNVHVVISNPFDNTSWPQLYWHEEGHRMDNLLSGALPYFLSEQNDNWQYDVKKYSQKVCNLKLPIHCEDLADYLQSDLYTPANYPAETVAQMVRYHITTYQYETIHNKQAENDAANKMYYAYPELWSAYKYSILSEAEHHAFSSQIKREQDINEFSRLTQKVSQKSSQAFNEDIAQQYASVLRIKNKKALNTHIADLKATLNQDMELPKSLSSLFNDMDQKNQALIMLAQERESFIEKSQNFYDLQNMTVGKEERADIFDRLKQEFQSPLTPIVTAMEDKELLSRYLEAFKSGSPFGGSVLAKELSSLEYMASHIQNDASGWGAIEITDGTEAKNKIEKNIQQYLKSAEWKQNRNKPQRQDSKLQQQMAFQM